MPVNSKILLNIYQTMVKIRAFEDEIVRRWPEQEMRSPPHFYTGQEAVAAAACAAIKSSDKAVGNYRGHGYYLAKGGNEKVFIAEMYCRITGSNSGKGGSMLLSDPKAGYVGSTAIVGGGIPIATGIALGFKLLKQNNVVLSFFGDAATEEGVFYESLNFAALKKLPIIFICENNLYAVTTHISKRRAKPENLHKHAEVYDVPSFKIDGNDPIEVFNVVSKSVKSARLGNGPSFIEALTYRWHEHVGENLDDYSGLRTRKELQLWQKKDPIKKLEGSLLRKKILTQQKIDKIKSELASLVGEAFEFAIQSPLPKKEDLLTNTYA